MKINYENAQNTKFYIRQNNRFGRVYISIEPALLVQASGDLKSVMVKVLGQEESQSENRAIFYWSNINRFDVSHIVNAIYELGSSDDRLLGIPVGVSLLFKKINKSERDQAKHALRIVG